jgi:flagellar hook-associated protein FlgK
MLPFEVIELMGSHKNLDNFVRNELMDNIKKLVIEINEMKERIDHLDNQIKEDD